jgi:transposase
LTRIWTPASCNSNPQTIHRAEVGVTPEFCHDTFAGRQRNRRQSKSQIYAREGVELDRATLAEWVGSICTLGDPLLGALSDYVMSAQKVHADDTPIPVLAPGTGKKKTGRLWTYVRDDQPSGSTDPPAVLFRYSPDRKGERPQAHLQRFRGIQQADGYAGFQGLYDRQDEPLVEAACWAHARRKYFDLHAAMGSPVALEALERIGA